MEVKISLTSLKVYDNGDPSHETNGELFYKFKINERTFVEQSRSRPTKVRDGQTINFNNQKTIENVNQKRDEIIFEGFVADKDSGFNKKDEKASFKVTFNWRNKFKKGTNTIYLRDGRLWVKLNYKVEISTSSSQVNKDEIKRTKSASLTVVSFEDDPFYNLVQHAHNNYSHAFKDYDKSVLIKSTFNGIIRPTKIVQDYTADRIIEELRLLADEGYYIDLFIHSHGTCNAITLKTGDVLWASDIDKLATGSYANGKFPLRMVYQVNCNASTLNDNWRAVGAKVVCGASDINYYPIQYNDFVRRWNRGERFDRSLSESATQGRTTMQLLIVAQSVQLGYNKCGPFKSVLGKNKCANSYFTNEWHSPESECSFYDENLTGKQNMNRSSRMIISGDVDMRKTDTNFVW
ncbi:MAG: hypothetical protein KUG68_12600 [Flavobacteriaceae bacterium]|nr:hypothetical protein [Flavobacteriaceae bacterium]